MNIRRLKNGALAFGAASLLALGYGVGLNHVTQAQALTPQSAESATSVNRVALPDFSSIVAQFGPAVVNVHVSGTVKTGGQELQMPRMDPRMDPNDPFSDFFRQFRQQEPQQGVPTRGIGSGFIVSPDGIILTNAHVVAGADEVTVKLTDKREFRAKVLGVDKATDVAVLKIDAHNLPVVKIGDANQERVGEWAVAIGSPFGFENTATAGIISAKARSLPDQGYVQFIQTDVPVNPGNSGGPLFNLNGEVIGINSQIYSGTGGYQGVSFAIPINLAMGVEQQLVAHGKVERVQLGVTIQSLDQSLAQAFGLKQANGALISSVSADSAGAKAGLAPGDVILKFNGHAISDASDLPPLVASAKPGDTAIVSIWRKGSARDVSVKLSESSASAVVAEKDAAGSGNARLGLSLRPLTPDERSEAKLSSGGLLVQDVSGPAAKAGIEQGDIVLALNGEPVSSVSQMRQLLTKDGNHLALLVQHNDAKIFVPIDLG